MTTRQVDNSTAFSSKKRIYFSEDKNLLTIHQASLWASKYLNKKVTDSNISYLIQYGRIKKYYKNKITFVSKIELLNYYKNFVKNKKIDWQKKLGNDLNWNLSFDFLREKDTTKHVHRLHPYKGKFIPQLVEYFLDNKTDKFKKEVFFKPGDIVLDPFCGSGTTLVQANELGIHAIGIDISIFNTNIANAKTRKYNLPELQNEFNKINSLFLKRKLNLSIIEFEKALVKELNAFNKTNFPTPEFKRKVRIEKIDEEQYSKKKEKEFIFAYKNLIEKYSIKLNQSESDSFIGKWFLQPIRDDMYFILDKIQHIKNKETKQLLEIVLSRAVRSCRATTHSDLATLKHPITTPYYCKKHGKICKPLFSIWSWWNRYSHDTLARIQEFNSKRTKTKQVCLKGDSKKINLITSLKKADEFILKLLKTKKIKGIFTSPPYVGLIDYHNQHAYAYDLFKYKRADELEIGSLAKGQSSMARLSYVKSIAKTLQNSKKYLARDFNIFIVANDKYELYPRIAELSGMKIVNIYKRPVLNRSEKGRGTYFEKIFHLKD